ncbi:hypothetical protein ACFLVB_03520 [Chloroflexota bacterium]
MNKKLYSSTQRNQVYDWIDRWFELTMLIIEVTCTDEPPFSVPPPTELDEIDYQRLHFWLSDHEAPFVQLWQDYYNCQEWAIQQEHDDSGADKLTKNPFSCCYQSENLYQLAQELDMQSGKDLWEPNDYRARTAFGLLINMGERMVEFLDWVDERTEESGLG